MSWIRVIATLLFISLPVQAQVPRTGGLAEPDKEVLRQMAEIHLAGIEAGRLAAQNAPNREVKQLGVDMAQGHREMLNQVVGVTQSYGEQQPFGPNATQRGLLIELAGLSGAAFQRQFLSNAVEREAEALEIAERAAGEAANADVKALAEWVTPRIRLQLHAASTLGTTPVARK